jgi:zinc-binding in reverse transcriptase
MWLASKNRILTKANLVKKGWVCATQYSFCSAEKIVDHIFVQCRAICLVTDGAISDGTQNMSYF